ncbi:MAG: translation initiation factor IF-5A [Candidatus Altiarchaeota archaeon]|nr:translation initiation factor IF-5A [Candidatus Altiarchaeota archaeon]
MEITFEDCGKLRKGRYVVIDGHPCRVLDIQTGKSGKHGHAKSRITATSIFDGSKKGMLKPVDARVEVPIVDKRQAQVLSVSGKHVQLMDNQSYETFDANVPEGMTFTSGETIFFWIIMGKKILERSD